MAYLSDFDISGYGLSAQRFRMNVISSNIANANTTRTAEGGPYRRREVIFKAIDFDKQLNNTINSKNDLLQNENPLDDPDAPDFPKPALMSVIVDKVVRDDKDFKLKFDPNHPDADAKGYIMLPNINPVIEMADLIEATRAYQANVSAFQSAKTIANSAIDMLK
ncbi:flagellar basal body rod protein FlgC [Campylobacter hyointestinalis]|uniref:Flagellar basal-body rod protein FlgC n=1 Tax=Campylobacter hyointestinalis subsp. hyointestinalis TaxID=91352 RepID=A0A855N7Y2_CAMHY|nr:flagellar basal body rod protein FlgC [Campylobacter hyointestinalis]ANE32739.1 flagellar proximal rod protein [Campylobacter hyointestinalis subsp. hyointestinalis LMG 9260]PPB51596.1 flagellar basal body rod protein FlgC [Campylobacter hyointestinalis subsp. hyointestinalis]PPB54099.1 flagellar basal body rod protein FlgC [Campylobacter hyointestinalis subsp. hyointestinalis]PPB60156.1 flagellar basal body rod protein FlgC [Campylobacter hyointestinalis subsp. hyointestinalis]PPB62740.1 f